MCLDLVVSSPDQHDTLDTRAVSYNFITLQPSLISRLLLSSPPPIPHLNAAIYAFVMKS